MSWALALVEAVLSGCAPSGQRALRACSTQRARAWLAASCVAADALSGASERTLSATRAAAQALLPRGDAAALDAHIGRLVAAHALEDPVYVLDLGMVARLWGAWAAAMPRVAPFYAVKCNDDEALLALLVRVRLAWPRALWAWARPGPSLLGRGWDMHSAVRASLHHRAPPHAACAAAGVQAKHFARCCCWRLRRMWHKATMYESNLNLWQMHCVADAASHPGSW
jgi:hypothetical protein